MPIHEQSLIRPENIHVQEDLEIDGVDVSGHWSTFISPRVVTDYNDNLQDEIAALPGGGTYSPLLAVRVMHQFVHTVNAINPDFNPRYWIYLVRLGMEDELLRDKDIIWQCVSCNKCTYVCPRDVYPEGVMKSLSHWLELKGHTPKSPSMHFDEVFSSQVFETGKIEEGRIIRGFFGRMGMPLMQDWLVEMVRRMVWRLPVKLLITMGLANFIRPRTRNWGPARDAIKEYVEEQHKKQAAALNLPAKEGH